jgi:hypothetical protein
VTIIKCVEQPPHFVAVQWNGTNQQEVHNFIFSFERYVELYFLGETIDANSGTLIVHVHQAGTLLIPLYGWVVFGPLWSEWQPDSRRYPPSIFTHEQFESRFTQHGS